MGKVDDLREKINSKIQNEGETPIIKMVSASQDKLESISENVPNSKFVTERNNYMSLGDTRQIEIKTASKISYGIEPICSRNEVHEHTIVLNNMDYVEQEILPCISTGNVKWGWELPETVGIYHGVMSYKYIDIHEPELTNEFVYHGECFIVIDSEAKTLQVIPISFKSLKALMSENFSAFQVYYFEKMVMVGDDNKISLKIRNEEPNQEPLKRKRVINEGANTEKVKLSDSELKEFLSNQIPLPLILKRDVTDMNNHPDEALVPPDSSMYPIEIMLLGKMQFNKFYNTKLPWIQLYSGIYTGEYDRKLFSKNNTLEFPYLAKYNFGRNKVYNVARFYAGASSMNTIESNVLMNIGVSTHNEKNPNHILPNVYNYLQTVNQLFESIVYVYGERKVISDSTITSLDLKDTKGSDTTIINAD